MPEHLPVGDHLAIEQLFARYNLYFDTQQTDAWLDLFAEDGRFEITGYRAWTGHHELREFLREQMGSRRMQHWVNNLVVTPGGPDEALVDSYGMNLYQQEDGRPYVRRTSFVHSRVVKDRGEWRFQSRTSTIEAR